MASQGKHTRQKGAACSLPGDYLKIFNMFIQQSLENYLGFPCKCVSFCEAGTYRKPSGDSVKDLRVLQVARRGLEGSFLLSRFCVLPHHPPLVPFSCTFVLSFPSQQGLGEITTAGVGPCCGLVAAFILYSPNPFQSPILLKDKGYFFFLSLFI